jgi:hypothetical protein
MNDRPELADMLVGGRLVRALLLLGVLARVVDFETEWVPPADEPELRMVSPEPVETNV